MNLSAPTNIVFIISLVIAIVAVLIFLNVLPFAAVSSFWIMAIAYVVLAVGNLLKGA